MPMHRAVWLGVLSILAMAARVEGFAAAIPRFSGALGRQGQDVTQRRVGACCLARSPGSHTAQGLRGTKQGGLKAASAQAGGSEAGALWGSISKKDVHAATVDWVKQIVIGLNLCPFALDSMPGLKVVVADVSSRDGALGVIHDELVSLSKTEESKPATTLIALPPMLFEQLRSLDGGEEADGGGDDGLGNFEEFLELVEDAQEVAKEVAETHPEAGEALLLTFHPSSTYSDVESDPADWALRSPFPTVHLLRASDVTMAEEQCEAEGKTTEDIALENEARLRGTGWKEMSRVMEKIMAAHGGTA